MLDLSTCSIALSSTETEKAAPHVLSGAAVERTKEHSHSAYTHIGQGENHTYEGRIRDSNYERINQTEAKCQSGTDKKSCDWSGRESVVLAQPLTLPF